MAFITSNPLVGLDASTQLKLEELQKYAIAQAASSNGYKSQQVNAGMIGTWATYPGIYQGSILNSWGTATTLTASYTDKTEVAPKPRQTSAKSLVLQIDSLLGLIKKAKCIA